MNKWLSAVIALCPAASLAQQGAWEDWINFGPSAQDSISAIHLIHVYDGSTGKIVALPNDWDCDTGCGNCATDPRGLNRLWTPPAMGSTLPGGFEDIRNCRTFLFCAGHSALPDGKILVVGGGDQVVYNHANRFHPEIAPVGAGGNSWNNVMEPASMTYHRFYPTATTLADGRVLVCSGTDENMEPVTVPELYELGGNWTQLTTAAREQPTYPWMFLLPDGSLLDAGPGESRFLVSPTWTWGDVVYDPVWPLDPVPPGEHGSAVMYEPGKVMKCGGDSPAVATTFVVDLNTVSDPHRWLVAADMKKARRDHNLVVLPDGKVLAVGGATGGMSSQAVYEAEIFDPASGTWTLDASMAIARMYHSTAMLLRDGRVVATGGNPDRTAQVYRPPYITSGAPRPTIMSAPAYMRYGDPYEVLYLRNGGPVVTKACLIRLGAVTHGFDQDQRRVPLAIQESSPVSVPLYQVTVAAPANGNIAPPGYYMLFILNQYASNQFAPCELAAYVRVGP